MPIVSGIFVPRSVRLSKQDKAILAERRSRRRAFTRAEKDAYMHSEEWRLMQRIWLKRSKHRCQLFPWKRIGKKVRGRYRGYEVHHLHREAYRRLGKERYKRDVVVLSKFAHQWVYHRILSLGKTTVGKQKSFPNAAQRLTNFWCKLPIIFKWIWIIVSTTLSIIVLLDLPKRLHHWILSYTS